MATPIETASLFNSTYASRTSWSGSITVPTGKEPTTVVLVAHCRNDAFANAPTFAGVAMPVMRYGSASYSYIGLWYKENVAPGTYTLAMTGIASAYSTGISVIGLYHTSGANFDNNIVATSPASTNLTVNPNLRAGHIWVEFVRQRNLMPTAGSGQSGILANGTMGVFYKKDLGSGIVTSKINSVEATEMAYIGFEFLPPGSLFSVPPMPIG